MNAIMGKTTFQNVWGHITEPSQRSHKRIDKRMLAAMQRIYNKLKQIVPLSLRRQMMPLARGILIGVPLLVKTIAMAIFSALTFPHSMPAKIVGNEDKKVLPTKAEIIQPPPPNWLDLPPDLLEKIYPHLDIEEIMNLMQVSKADHMSIANSKIWQEWATKLSFPIAENENAYERVTTLLKYFAINPKTGLATRLKESSKLEEALKIYPAAWIVIPTPECQSIFDAYCRHPSGSQEQWQFDTRCKNAQSYLKLRSIVANPEYVGLSL